MNKLAKYWIVFLLSIAPFMAVEARETPLVNFENVSILRADGKPLTAEKVKRAILLAGVRHNWSITPDKNGQMIATINVRGKHTATVEIPYSASSFSIKYRDSVNLSYRKDDTGVEMIHPNYNRWIDNLRRDIVSQVLTLQD